MLCLTSTLPHHHVVSPPQPFKLSNPTMFLPMSSNFLWVSIHLLHSMCMRFLPAYVLMHHMHAWCPARSRGDINPDPDPLCKSSSAPNLPGISPAPCVYCRKKQIELGTTEIFDLSIWQKDVIPPELWVKGKSIVKAQQLVTYFSHHGVPFSFLNGMGEVVLALSTPSSHLGYRPNSKASSQINQLLPTEETLCGLGRQLHHWQACPASSEEQT